MMSHCHFVMTWAEQTSEWFHGTVFFVCLFFLTTSSAFSEEEKTTHSSIPAWRIPGTGEPGGLLSMGSHRVGHYWSDLAATAAFSEKSMATHSSTLAWKILWMEEPGRLQSMALLSWTRQSDFTFTFRFHALEKETATHSSVLAWRIPGTGEPGGLPSMGSHRVGHDWSDLATTAFLGWVGRPSIHPVNVSIMTNRYLYPWETGIWVTSIFQSSPG